MLSRMPCIAADSKAVFNMPIPIDIAEKTPPEVIPKPSIAPVKASQTGRNVAIKNSTIFSTATTTVARVNIINSPNRVTAIFAASIDGPKSNSAIFSMTIIIASFTL